MNEILQEKGPNASLLLVKIDIEGFESELFASNTEWVDKAFAIIIEIHDDRLPGQHSSRAMQRALFGQGGYRISTLRLSHLPGRHRRAGVGRFCRRTSPEATRVISADHAYRASNSVTSKHRLIGPPCWG
ncbi:hypothetical protein [Methylobacterium dankookense]|uniref:hypothetical protein n=1 Tax=Methylobacterium dankookense TaxID=560405 RepID=UPI00314524B5